MEQSITRGLWVTEWGRGYTQRKKENSNIFSTLNGISIKTNNFDHKTQALTAETCLWCLCATICNGECRALGPCSLSTSAVMVER